MKVSKIVLVLLICSILAVCMACSNNHSVSENDDKEKIVKKQVEIEGQLETKEETNKSEKSVEKFKTILYTYKIMP